MWILCSKLAKEAAIDAGHFFVPAITSQAEALNFLLGPHSQLMNFVRLEMFVPNDADWSDIMGQVHANQGLTADLLGPDVNEDNFAEEDGCPYCRKKKLFKTFSDDQLKAEFDKIRNAAADLQAQNLRRSLKRLGADVEQPGSKRSKSSATPQTPVFPPMDKKSSSAVILHAPNESFIQVLSGDDSDDSDDDTDPLFFGMHLLHGKFFYGMVVKPYEVQPLDGTGVILGEIFMFCFESIMVVLVLNVWNDQQGVGYPKTGWFSLALILEIKSGCPEQRLQTEDLSRKLEVNYVKFQFRGGLLVPTGQSEFNDLVIRVYSSIESNRVDLNSEYHDVGMQNGMISESVPCL
ncbi:hypothetical protein Tco_1104025 [Tanacetum coccineum]